MKLGPRRMKHGESGSVLVEFSLSIALILTVLLGIIDLGRALYAYDWVSNAARQGARFMMVRGTGCTLLAGGCPATGTDATNYVKSLGVGIDTGQVTVSTTCLATGGALIPPPCAPRGWVQVQVHYTFSFLSPFTTVLPWTMTSSSKIYVQN